MFGIFCDMEYCMSLFIENHVSNLAPLVVCRKKRQYYITIYTIFILFDHINHY